MNPFFSYGLRVQFQKWGFVSVELTDTCEHVIQNLWNRLPALIILDEKYIAKEQECGNVEFIAGLMNIPFILLSANQKSMLGNAESRIINHSYTCLDKPCHIADLQAAVENLLGVPVFER